LENVIERASTLSNSNIILPEDLPRRVELETSKISKSSLPSQMPLSELEKIYIQKVLEETGGNKKKAADILGIDRRTLYRMATRLGLSIKR
jgi:DNA-binding NtrC family response regulator